MLDILILLVIALVVVTLVGHIVSAYRAADGSWWERILSGARESATYLWSKIVAAGGLLLVGADYAAQFFNLPEVQAFMTKTLTPARMGVALTVVAVVTIVARLRTLRRSQ